MPLPTGFLGSVQPYQPAGIWAEATFGKKRYSQDKGEKLYRRSIYTFWRRIVGPTMFFDVAKRQTCSVRTVRTNTPLHALTTLNDITFVEIARALAQRVLEGEDDFNKQIELVKQLEIRGKTVMVPEAFKSNLGVADEPTPNDKAKRKAKRAKRLAKKPNQTVGKRLENDQKT